jgi:hypothetical protein
MKIPGDRRTRHRRITLIGLVNSMADRWPLTVRAWHYQLFGHGLCENTMKAYKQTIRDLTALRNAGLVPWAAVSEHGRSIQTLYKFEDAREYLEFEIESMKTGYQRCFLQNQEYDVRVVVEKLTMLGMIQAVTNPLCIPADAISGHSSTTYVHSLAEQISASKRATVLLILSDYDWHGQQIATSTENRIERYTDNAIIRRIALTAEQVEEYSLPVSPDRSGHQAGVVELDALNPENLESIIMSGLSEWYDFEIADAERAIQAREQRQIVGICNSFLAQIADSFN